MYVQVAPSSSLPLPLLQKSIPPTPTLKNVFWLQAKKKKKNKNKQTKKAVYFFAILKQDNKKTCYLDTNWKNCGMQEQFFPSHKADHFWSPDKQSLLEAHYAGGATGHGSKGRRTQQQEKLWYWSEGKVARQQRLLAGNSCPAILMQVVPLCQTLTFDL